MTSNSIPALWFKGHHLLYGVAWLMHSSLSASDLPLVRSCSPSNRALAHAMEVNVPWGLALEYNNVQAHPAGMFVTLPAMRSASNHTAVRARGMPSAVGLAGTSETDMLHSHDNKQHSTEMRSTSCQCTPQYHKHLISQPLQGNLYHVHQSKRQHARRWHGFDWQRLRP